jgi:hypothetical protein
MLKATGTKRLNLDYDELLSSFAFNFKLGRYNTAEVEARRRQRAADARIVRLEGLVDSLMHSIQHLQQPPQARHPQPPQPQHPQQVLDTP